MLYHAKSFAGLPWADIPTHLLHAELLRRQRDARPACGTKGGRGQYNTPIHVFALVLILLVSTAGTLTLTHTLCLAGPV